MKAVFVFLFVFVTQIFCYSQNADCDKLISLNELNVKIDHVGGYGDKLEFQGNALGNNSYITEAVNILNTD